MSASAAAGELLHLSEQPIGRLSHHSLHMPFHVCSTLCYNSAQARARLTLRFSELISRVIIRPSISVPPARRCLSILLLAFFAARLPASAQQVRLTAASGGIAEISSSGPQQRQGDLFIADGDVDIT